MPSIHLIIVTGLSGAGKSLVLRRLEDLGFYCVDNLPSSMANQFVSLCQQAVPPIRRIALGIDSREHMFFENWQQVLKNLIRSVPDSRLLFLDCANDVLARRFQETRRHHPLIDCCSTLQNSIAKERELLDPLRQCADDIIDTTNLKPAELFHALQNTLHLDVSRTISLVFMSFGYKNGLPLDADFVFDTRFLSNPFYEPELRALSGLDKPVKDFLFKQEHALAFYTDIEVMLRRLLPSLLLQGKQRLVIAFGCTGGRHRSVASAEEMARRLQDGPYHVSTLHRDLMQEGDAIRARFHASSQHNQPGQ